jgi:hypothetical protein
MPFFFLTIKVEPAKELALRVGLVQVREGEDERLQVVSGQDFKAQIVFDSPDVAFKSER